MLRHRLRSLFRQGAMDRELERELSLHLEQLAREHVEAGMFEADAQLARGARSGLPGSFRSDRSATPTPGRWSPT